MRRLALGALAFGAVLLLSPQPGTTVRPSLAAAAPGATSQPAQPLSAGPAPSAVPTPEAPAVSSPTPSPAAAPQAAPVYQPPFIIEAPPPSVLEKIRQGKVPNVTIADLAAVNRQTRGAAAGAAAQGQLVPQGAPVVGTDSAVVLLAQYTDLAPNPSDTVTTYQDLLFGTGAGSMRTYYQQNSYNQYDITGTVTNWVTVAHARNWYADNDGTANTTPLCNSNFGDDYGCGSDPDHNTQALIRDAVLAADPTVDFSAFAKNGVVRNLIIVHAGQGADANQSCRVCPWSTQWGLGSPIVADGVTIQSALVVPEYTFVSGDSTIGVFAHEVGHLAFGLPDLYDTDYSTGGIGRWSLMSGGEWNGGGASPAYFDAWSKAYVGWLTPTVVSSDGPQSLPASETSPTVLKLWTNGTPGNEYFLVENREQTGFDQDLPGSGLLIWHIDDNLWFNFDDCHPHVLLVTANSPLQLPCALPLGSASPADPWPGTNNRTSWNDGTFPSSRSYGGADTAVSVESISGAGATMTADVSVTGSPLSNDSAAGATQIGGFPFTDTQNTTAATLETGEPQPCGFIGATLWYRFTPAVSPPASAQLTVDTVGSNFDTVLAVYSDAGGAVPSTLTEVDCNDDAGGEPWSQVSFVASPGVAYYIQAGGYDGATGDLIFHADVATGSISGVVTDALSNPIAGASVSASLDGVCCGSGSALTAADGTYTISGLSAGGYDVQASAPGFAVQYFDHTPDYNQHTVVTVNPNATTTAINFALEQNGSITGTITDANGDPLSGATVWAYTPGDGCVCVATSTAPDGTYTLSLAPGTYDMLAFKDGYTYTWYPKQYPYEGGTPVTVSAGAATTGIDVTLELGAVISGTITDSSGTPVANQLVQAAGTNGGFLYGATTASDGTYATDNLAPDSYRVWVSAPNALTTYYVHATDYSAATLVDVATAAHVAGIDIAVEPGASISGVIRDGGGNPIAGASVQAQSDPCCVGSGSATTAGDGSYTITTLVPGSYRVSASASGLPGRFYNNTYDYNAAQLVSVSSGATTTGIDITLDVGGSISGVIRDSGGNPIAGASVQAARCCIGSSTTTAADGTYTISALAPGSYRVWASAAGLPQRYYNGTYDYDAAQLVTVTASVTTTGIDIALEPGGSISGVIRDGGGNPIAGASVQAQRDPCCGFGSAVTASDGSYTISVLAPGFYRVQASDAGLPARYYNNTYDYDAVQLVNVGGGATTAGIDITLAPGGAISGVIRDSGGNPIAGASVQASANPCCSFGSTTTALDGSYTIPTLAAGTYHVLASAPTFATRYYNGTYDFSAAAPVTVTSGVTTTGIDIALELGGTISGVVRDAHGSPIAGASVQAQSSTCCGFGSATTAIGGSYTITGLEPGSYRVQASAPGFLDRYYDNADFSGATLIAVTSGGTTTGIDFALSRGGSISGVVRDTGGNPIAGASVDVSGDGFGQATTTGDGTYTISGLVAGSYTVRAGAPTFVGQYFDGAKDFSTATSVSVSLAVTTPNIDFALALGQPPAAITLAATPPAVVCDGSHGTSVSALVTDANGDAVGDGTVVNFSLLQAGTISSAVVTTGFGGAFTFVTPDASDLATGLDVDATAGAAGGSVHIDCLTPADASAAPIDITAIPFTDARSTGGFTTESGETLPCGGMGATAWYRLVLSDSPPVDEWLTVDTVGSDFNTALAIYSAASVFTSPPGGVTNIGCNANGSSSSLGFDASSPGTYYVQVGGAAGATGNLVLNVHCGADDADCDGLSGADEITAGTNPNVADTDADGLIDGAEVRTYQTNPLVADSDGDGLTDGDEVRTFGTDPNVADTDADGCGDGTELSGNHVTGGQRDPLDAWDFFDVTGDHGIDLDDAIAVLLSFGKAPDSVGYDARLDRYIPDAGQPWRTAAAIDGNGIDLEDAIANLLSFGDTC